MLRQSEMILRRRPVRRCDAVIAAREAKLDYILILPWNLKDEIVQQMRRVGKWGAKFIVPIPAVSMNDPNDALT